MLPPALEFTAAAWFSVSPHQFPLDSIYAVPARRRCDVRYRVRRTQEGLWNKGPRHVIPNFCKSSARHARYQWLWSTHSCEYKERKTKRLTRNKNHQAPAKRLGVVCLCVCVSVCTCMKSEPARPVSHLSCINLLFGQQISRYRYKYLLRRPPRTTCLMLSLLLKSWDTRSKCI